MFVTIQRRCRSVTWACLANNLTPRNVREARWAGVTAVLTPGAALLLIGAVHSLMGNDFQWHSTFLEPIGSYVYTFVVPVIACLVALTIALLPNNMFRWVALPLTIAFVGLQTWVSWAPDGFGDHPNAGVGQVLFLVPVLFAAYAFRRLGMWIVLSLTIIANATLMWFMSPKHTVDVVDWLTLSVMALAMALPIARSRDHATDLREDLAQQATLDGLTGLLNRKSFDYAITQVERTACLSKLGVGLILLDIDHFKTLNDEHGHPVGDAVLCELADALRRHADTVPGATAYRLGGDELVMLLPNVDAHTVSDTAMNVVASAAETRVFGNDGRTVPVTASVGLAHWPTHTADVSAVYSVADSGLYAAKQSGRNAHRVGEATTPPAQNASTHRAATESHATATLRSAPDVSHVFAQAFQRSGEDPEFRHIVEARSRAIQVARKSIWQRVLGSDAANKTLQVTDVTPLAPSRHHDPTPDQRDQVTADNGNRHPTPTSRNKVLQNVMGSALRHRVVSKPHPGPHPR